MTRIPTVLAKAVNARGAALPMRATCAVMAVALIAAWPERLAAFDNSRPQFEADILPILAAKCQACHGAQERKAELDLRTFASLLKGGESGPAIDLKQPSQSRLIDKIDQNEMPPQDSPQLTRQEIDLIRRWAATGAAARNIAEQSIDGDTGRNFWAFQKPRRPNIPAVHAPQQVRTPIDAFILAKLEASGLGFSPEADPATLVRRIYLDLLGLPPSPEEFDAFLQDTAPDAWARLVDRLLASPRFGERWGRHWLDIVGYVDTVGFDTDATNIILSENKWRYRDYVIQAFNRDLPFDEFVRQQLAGDELVDWQHAETFTPQILDSLIATGYLRTARDETHEPESNIPLSYFGVLHDTVEIVGSSLLGLTINCARCHSHKFEPISQQDYYRLMAIFTAAYNPKAWKPVYPWKAGIVDRTLPDVSPAEKSEIERRNAELDRTVVNCQEKINGLCAPYRERLRARKLETIPEQIRNDVQAALTAPADKRTDVQKYLADKFEKSLEVKQEEIDACLDDADKAQISQMRQQIAELGAKKQRIGKVQALFDVGPPPPTYLLRRGSYESPGDEVQPGFPSVLCESDEQSVFRGQALSSGSSGRRLALARWLTQPRSAPAGLIARVMINRAWQHLFGQGIVPTTENLGQSGERPTHPELLEWLTAEWIESGWRLKPLLRLMTLSSVYRQASSIESAATADSTPADSAVSQAEQVDPGNKLLWRMRLKRLEGEAIRDCILATSGNLNLAMGGPPVPIEAQSDGRVIVPEKKVANRNDPWRRSVYLLFRRAYNLSLLTVFDQPLVATSCPRRDTSAVAPQSLMMLNDEFVRTQADQFATRVVRESRASPQSRVETAFQLALARRPDAQEATIGQELLMAQTAAIRESGAGETEAQQQALAQLCLVLFNTAEFLYAE